MLQQELFKSIYGKSLGDAGNIELLQSDIAAYPYFGIAHFFLLKEQSKKESNYAAIAEKTAIFFNNKTRLNIKITSDNHLKINNIKESDSSKPDLSNKTNAPSNKATADEELLFEPLYTTDYFASQGIKFQEEVKPDDKLGKQLKSFTEWLKTMKKVHGYKLPENTATIDKTVEQMAEKSNIEADVITEAMAEVYIKQQKFAKAKEIYSKLSLQNPSKSTYFAHKIESLKDK